MNNEQLSKLLNMTALKTEFGNGPARTKEDGKVKVLINIDSPDGVKPDARTR